MDYKKFVSGNNDTQSKNKIFQRSLPGFKAVTPMYKGQHFRLPLGEGPGWVIF